MLRVGSLKIKGEEGNRRECRLLDRIKESGGSEVERENRVSRMHAIVESGEALDERRLECGFCPLKLCNFRRTCCRKVLLIQKYSSGKRCRCDEEHNCNE